MASLELSINLCECKLVSCQSVNLSLASVNLSVNLCKFVLASLS